MIDNNSRVHTEDFDPPGNDQQAPPQRGTFPILSIGDLKDLPTPRWIIRDILPADSLCVLVGQPGAGKSFVALDMALTIASGVGAWNGHKAASGTVIYMAGEGVGGLLRRVQAWACYRIGDPLDNCQESFFVVPRVPTLLEPLDIRALTDEIKAMPTQPVLVVVDTLARALSGGDENSSRDVGGAIQALDYLHRETGSTVLCVHHLGKDETKGARGSSALLGGCDMMAGLWKDGGTVVMRSMKAKDSEPFHPVALRLEQVTLGLDDEGEAVTSLRVRGGTKAEEKAEEEAALAESAAKVLELLRTPAYAEGLSQSDIRGYLKAMAKTTFYRASKALIVCGAIVKRGSNYRVQPAPTQPEPEPPVTTAETEAEKESEHSEGNEK